MRRHQLSVETSCLPNANRHAAGGLRAVFTAFTALSVANTVPGHFKLGDRGDGTPVCLCVACVSQMLQRVGTYATRGRTSAE